MRSFAQASANALWNTRASRKDIFVVFSYYHSEIVAAFDSKEKADDCVQQLVLKYCSKAGIEPGRSLEKLGERQGNPASKNPPTFREFEIKKFEINNFKLSNSLDIYDQFG